MKHIREYEEYCDYGSNSMGKFLKENPKYDNNDFIEYVITNNQADRDSGELNDVSMDEILRLKKEYDKQYSTITESNKPIIYKGLKFVLSVYMEDLHGLNISLIADSKTLDKMGDAVDDWGEAIAKHMKKKMGVDVTYKPDSEHAGLNFRISTFDLAEIIKGIL